MNNKKHNNNPLNPPCQGEARFRNRGFTLVELVVVATILAILGAVGFSAYTGYIDGARDSNRVVELGSIRSGLQTYLINSNNGLPLPGDYVTVQDGVEIIGYQGYASQDILDTIDLKKGGTDPLDGSYYSYYVSETRNHFQLLGFLEEQNSNLTSSLSPKGVNALDYSSRFPTVTGESLGIMVGTGNDKNIPIQELDEVVTTSNGILDISGTSTEYTAIIKDDYSITGDSSELSTLAGLANSGGQIRGSCKELIESNPGLLGKNGTFAVQPQDDLISVYCDMSFDGGGWTFVLFFDNAGKSTDNEFENFVGDYRVTRDDTGNNYSIPTNIFSHTEMLVTLETPDPVVAENNNDIVFYSYEQGHDGFNKGPGDCEGLIDYSYKFSANSSYTSGGKNNVCDYRWYSRTVNDLHLILLHKTSSVGVYRGQSLPTSTAIPETTDGWYKNGWFYIR